MRRHLNAGLGRTVGVEDLQALVLPVPPGRMLTELGEQFHADGLAARDQRA